MADIMTPALGESVSEATVARWTKKPGEAVKKDEPLVELETDKVSLEVAAPADGVLSDVAAPAGELQPMPQAGVAPAQSGPVPDTSAKDRPQPEPAQAAGSDAPLSPS